MTSVSLGVCRDDPYKIKKSPSFNNTVNCTIYGECSVISPNLIIDYFNGVEDCNYAQFLGKFYWIRDVILIPGRRCKISMEEDPFYTYANYILSCEAYADRSESKVNPMVVDGNYPTKVTNTMTVKKFSLEPFAAGNDTYLLTVIGGGRAVSPDPEPSS